MLEFINTKPRKFSDSWKFVAFKDSFAGYVRLINNIDLSNGEINTRTNFTLGDDKSVTSIEGNGMTISGIVLDNTASNIEKTGLFAEIKNAYIIL